MTRRRPGPARARLKPRGDPAGSRPRGGAPAGLWLGAVAVTCAAVLLFFYPIVLGNVFVSPDAVAPAGFGIIANEAFQSRHVYALWNPYHFLGMPSFGSLAFVPFVYPPDHLFALLTHGFHFPELTWLLAHYLLLGLSMLVLLRAVGCGPEGATLGALTLALTPNLVAVGAFGHGSQIMTAAYLPLLLWLFDRFARRGSLAALAAFALAAALQLLRAHVQIVFYTWIALLGYAAFLGGAAYRAGRRAEALRVGVGLVAGLLLGFGMSAFLYLPTHEYAKLSIRTAGEGGGAGLQYATSWSFHPREILTFVVPSFFGFGGRTYWGSMPFTDYPNYMGIIPLALAAYGAWRARGVLRAYLVALFLAALVVSFGKHFGPLYALLYYHLPFFNKFRVPVMILVLVQFATAALAAIGTGIALGSGSSGRGPSSAPADGAARWTRAAALAGLGGVVVLVALQVGGPALESYALRSRPGLDPASARGALGMASVDALRSGLLLALGFGAIALHRRGRLTRWVAGAALVGLTAVDLWSLDRKIMDPQVGTRREYQEYFRATPEVEFLRSDSSLYRVVPLDWNDSRLAAFGIASVLGYHPAKPRLYQAFSDTAGIRSLPTLRFLNVKYILTDGHYPPGTEGVTLRHDGPVKVYEVDGALPRAYVVHRAIALRDDGAALAMLATLPNGSFEPGNEALWIGHVAPPLRPPAEPDSVRTLRYDFNECEYLVATAAPGLFVVCDQFDPDWTATVDGEPVTIHRVDYLLRGVLLEPGVHRVRFRYEPRALALGIRISTASAACTLLLGAVGWVAGRRRREGSKAAGGGSAGPPP